MARFEESEEIVQLIGFYTGQKLFGADILSVQEILRDPALEPDPDAPAFVEGRVNLRGVPVPVVDLRSRLDPGHVAETGAPVWLLIAQLEDTRVGYMVDAVTRIMKIASESILPAPELMLAGLRSQYIHGVCKTEFGLLIVADLANLLEANEVDALKT